MTSKPKLKLVDEDIELAAGFLKIHQYKTDNPALAALLGLPKGTMSSRLFRLKNKIEASDCGFTDTAAGEEGPSTPKKPAASGGRKRKAADVENEDGAEKPKRGRKKAAKKDADGDAEVVSKPERVDEPPVKGGKRGMENSEVKGDQDAGDAADEDEDEVAV